MNRFHTLRREQWIPRPLDEVFAFFSDAGNLEEITPPWLGFRILTPGPIPIAAGTKTAVSAELARPSGEVDHRNPAMGAAFLLHRCAVERSVPAVASHPSIRSSMTVERA